MTTHAKFTDQELMFGTDSPTMCALLLREAGWKETDGGIDRQWTSFG